MTCATLLVRVEAVVCEKDIAWAAGLFEGEGCIGVYTRPDGRVVLAVKVVMSDLDVLERLDKLFPSKGGIKEKKELRKDTYKQCWCWGLYAKEDCVAFLKAVYPYLGTRRKSKADELFAAGDRLMTKEEYNASRAGTVHVSGNRVEVITSGDVDLFKQHITEQLRATKTA